LEVILALTNPSDESFEAEIHRLLKEKHGKLYGKGLINTVVRKTVTKLLIGDIEFVRANYRLFSIGYAEIATQKGKFFGILGTWFLIEIENK